MLKEMKNSYIGKFDSPMAAFVYQNYTLNGDDGNDFTSDGNGEWINRYGKRILNGNDRGFIWLTRYANENEAIEAFKFISETIEPSDGGES